MSVRFKVIGCPIYSVATGHFGQLSSKAVMDNKLKSDYILPKTALPLTATRQFIRFGSTLFNGPTMKRNIRLHNSCETAIRIDWQIFLDSEIEENDQLLNLLCFISEPFQNLSSSKLSYAPSSVSENLKTIANLKEDITTKPLINLVLRPYDGKLIWQSSSAQICPLIKENYTRLFTVSPEQLIIPSHEECTATIIMNPMEAYSTMKCYSMFDLKAHIIGYLSIDSKEFLDIPRTNALTTEQLRFDITAKLEQPRLMIDLNDDHLEVDKMCLPVPFLEEQVLHFHSGLGRLLTEFWSNTRALDNSSLDTKYPAPHTTLQQVNRYHNQQQQSQQLLIPSTHASTCLLIDNLVLLREIFLKCTNSVPISICLKAKQPQSIRFQNIIDLSKERVSMSKDNCGGNSDNRAISNAMEDNRSTRTMRMSKKDFEQFYESEINLTLYPGKLRKVTIGYLLETDSCLSEVNSQDLKGNLKIDDSCLVLKMKFYSNFKF
ncbi:unnamed protein product [Heterobilharzia americana]|nr:unnamed protein product [Heterobilharzia americana]